MGVLNSYLYMRKNRGKELTMLYLELFLSFAKIGVLTFGGGYAMLPIIQREIVEKKGWVSDAEVMDYYAIGQCTPGVIAVNTATFSIAIGTFPAERKVKRLFSVKFQSTDNIRAIRYLGQ